MITKGNSSTGRGLAAYLKKEGNDRVEVWEIRGAAINDLDAAVDDWREFSKGTKCEKPIYHAQLNPDRALSREEWDKAIAIFEKEMGLEGHPRAVVMHEKKGREHVHLVYSRFNDLETMRAWSDSWNYLKHEKASREIERELGLEKTQGVHVEREEGPPRPDRTPSHKDIQQGERKGQDAREVKAEVSALYAKANGDGTAFVEGLEDAGYTLARGDRRGYVVLDREGGVYSLSRMAQIKAATLRDVLRDTPLEKLPSVGEVKEQRQEREKTAQADRRTEMAPVRPSRGETAKKENTKQQKKAESSKTQTRAARPPKIYKPRGEEVRVSGVVGGVANSLTKVADGILDFFVGSVPQKKPTPFEAARDREIWRQENKRRENFSKSLDSIQNSLAGGRPPSDDQIRELAQNFTSEDLQNLKDKGSLYVERLLKEREEYRHREWDGGRER